MVKKVASSVSMSALIATFIASIFFAPGQNCLAQGKTYKLAYDYAYKAGYEGGKDERAKGYDYQPEVVLAQPIFQILLKSMKQELNLSGSQEEEWDMGFRDGHNAGFKDGYYGYPKKKTQFD